MYTSPDFAKFVSLIRTAQSPADVLAAWGELDEPCESLRVVTAMPRQATRFSFPDIDILDLQGRRAVIPYYAEESLHFSSRALNRETLGAGRVSVPVDGSIMFDTNIASYISTYIHRRPFGGNQAEIVNLIRQILTVDPNFDYLFYMVENAKGFIERDDAVAPADIHEFWSTLNPDFKDNLIALQLFLSIDNDAYRRNGDDRPAMRRDAAETAARGFAHDFYFGDGAKANLDDLRSRHTIARLILCKTTAIHLGSNEGFRKKTRKLLEFMIERMGIYLERELMVAIRYFKEGRTFSFFEKLDRGKHIPRSNVREKIGNMAWDLMVPRFVESLSAGAGNGRFFIPQYLTWDGGLRESLEMHKAKACLYDDEKRRVVTIATADVEAELKTIVGDGPFTQYFDSEAVRRRLEAPKKTRPQWLALLDEVEEELMAAVHR